MNVAEKPFALEIDGTKRIGEPHSAGVAVGVVPGDGLATGEAVALGVACATRIST